ncbi:hypothetical protein F5880DRAFT_1512507 [Lentinula raphanica]|nr:hypothetical protein F5880DRAFT_1512507 [Lentinula raphanica]
MADSSPQNNTSFFFDQMEEFREEGTPMLDRTIFSAVPTSTKGVRFASIPLVFGTGLDTTTPSVVSNPTIASSSRRTRRFPTPIVYDSDSGSDSLTADASHLHTEGQSGRIPKPDGEAGRPGRGGYSLQVTLKWPVKKWKTVQGFIRARVLETLDCSLPFSDQSLLRLQAIRDQATTKFPFLNDYENLWVVDDMIRSRLKYEKSALKRKTDAKLADEARAKSRERLTISVPPSKRDRSNA